MPNAKPSPPLPDWRNAPSFLVLSVESNGSIRLGPLTKQTKVRLLGVELAGKEATRFLENLLKGKSVHVVYEPGKAPGEGEERVPAYLFRAPDGLFINLEVIARGYARATTNSACQYSELFVDREHEAATKHLGLWAHDFPKSETPQPGAAPASNPAKHRARRPSPSPSASGRLEVQREFNQALNQLMRNNTSSGVPLTHPSLPGPAYPPMIVVQPNGYYGVPPWTSPLPLQMPPLLGAPAPPLVGGFPNARP